MIVDSVTSFHPMKAENCTYRYLKALICSVPCKLKQGTVLLLLSITVLLLLFISHYARYKQHTSTQTQRAEIQNVSTNLKALNCAHWASSHATESRRRPVRNVDGLPTSHTGANNAARRPSIHQPRPQRSRHTDDRSPVTVDASLRKTDTIRDAILTCARKPT